MLDSIRRRLPLSYAVIALLAALALGAVLLLTLRSYYLRVERDYLRSNAQAIAFGLAQVLEEDPPLGALQAQLDQFSLLSQTLVKLLNSDGQLLATSRLSGRLSFPFARRRELLLFLPRGERTPVAIRLPLPVGPRPTSPASSTATPTLPGPTSVPPERDRLLDLAEYLRIAMPRAEAASGATYSSQVVRLPILGSEEQLLGFVELSQGPAYAREIVADVAWGWAIASAVAVALAAAAGWLISRRIASPLLALTEVTTSMADGDLAARADVARTDEIGTLARSYNQMADRVQEIIVTLQRFASDAAHEIHTPLTALRTNLELARRDILEGNDENLVEAQAQVERLEALTAGLLDLSRIESGSQGQSRAAVDLVRLAEEVGELYASRAEQAGVEFDLSLPKTPVTVQGDVGQLRSALSNLLGNAVKFTPQGGSIRFGVRQEGGMAVSWVEDTGIGIPDEDLPHLFQRFHRGRNAAAYPGSGLGLAIVKAIVEQHGGQIQAESHGQGSSFTLRIPIAPPSS